MIPKLLPLKRSGIKSDQEILDFGFDSEFCIDLQDDEIYYQLFIDSQYVGDTEYNEDLDEYEIVCYNEISYKIVKSIVQNKVNVWAWFNIPFTSEN